MAKPRLRVDKTAALGFGENTARRGDNQTRWGRSRDLSKSAKRFIVAASIVLGLFSSFVVAGLPLYVFPQVDRRQYTDAIFVLGPSLQSRVSIAKSMVDAGLSDRIVISVPAGGSADDWTRQACAGETPYLVRCFTPHPFTTEGEAHYIADLSEARGWNKITVITATYHISRARFVIKQCYAGQLEMVNDTAPLPLSVWAAQYIYQTGAFFKAIGAGCSS
ncbi:YdcF family protein [Subtercola endophyticus]|uniref:YdcF family protein n=1 Tax=Subtercola endophyticus TaxID=2895559 RepID=UPI001E3F75EA|nr:ElyC/SanA/YdcF family protein [Subtercola endophyticus]UFS57859.1 YdcF family protein [Subtercola endophyticus]